MYVKGVERSSKWSYTSLLITFLIFNQFSIWKKFWNAETYRFSTITCMYTVYIKACWRCWRLHYATLYGEYTLYWCSCWGCEILWIIDQRMCMLKMWKVWNTMNKWSKTVYVKGVKDMSNIALYWGVYPLNYTVDPNMKSSNYNKIRLKALNYFKLETLWIR